MLVSDGAAAAFATHGLSTAKPMAWSPLSTYMIVPDIEQAKGEAKNAAVLPTSSADTQHESISEDKRCIQVIIVSEVRSNMPVIKT